MKIPTLEKLATDCLIDSSLFRIPTSALGCTSMNNADRIIANIVVPKVQDELLKALVDDNRSRVREILNKNPKLIIIKPESSIVVSQRTGQIIKAESPLSMAIKRNQVKMVEILLPYIESMECGCEEALMQWESAEKARKASIQRAQNFDFKSIIKALDEQVTEYRRNPKRAPKRHRMMEKIYKDFRASIMVLSDEAARSGEHDYDIEALLKKAIEEAKELYTEESNALLEIFLVKIIGFIQSLLSPEDAKIWCRGIVCFYRDLNKPLPSVPFIQVSPPRPFDTLYGYSNHLGPVEFHVAQANSKSLDRFRRELHRIMNATPVDKDTLTLRAHRCGDGVPYYGCCQITQDTSDRLGVDLVCTALVDLEGGQINTAMGYREIGSLPTIPTYCCLCKLFTIDSFYLLDFVQEIIEDKETQLRALEKRLPPRAGPQFQP